MILDLAPWLEKSRWQTVPIRFLARQGTGHTPSRQHPEYWENCTIPWITLADVWQLRDGTRHTITETKEKISPLGLAHSAAVVHPKGTVILSRTASVGFSGIMGADMATSQDFATWTCGPRLLPRFLLHALRAMAPDLKRVAAGSTHKTIYMPDIERLRIPAPPLDEQRRIADFLDIETARIDELVRLDRVLSARLDEREKAHRDLVMDGMVTKFGEVPLRRLLRKIEQGSSPQCENSARQYPSEWAVLKLSAVKRGHFLQEENKRLPLGTAPERRYEVNPGDLLITRANTPELVGDTAVVTGSCQRLLLPDLIYRITLARGVEAEFIAQVLLSNRVRLLIEATARGSSQSMVKLRGEDIKAWPVPVADLSTQRASVKELWEMSAKVRGLRREVDQRLALLEERRRAVVTAAVTGELDVTTARGVASV